MHTHTHTNPYAHAHTFIYTHTGVCFNHKQMCICTHKNSFGSHPSYHTHTHTCKFVFELLSVATFCYVHIRCEPVVIQECTLLHTGMHAQAHTLTQTNTHTHKYKPHTHKYKPPTLVDTILLTLVPPAL